MSMRQRVLRVVDVEEVRPVEPLAAPTTMPDDVTDVEVIDRSVRAANTRAPQPEGLPVLETVADAGDRLDADGDQGDQADDGEPLPDAPRVAAAEVHPLPPPARPVPIESIDRADYAETQMATEADAQLLIGDLLARSRDLSVSDVESVLDLQRRKGLKFGEAAVALGLVSKGDVMLALSQQFRYAVDAMPADLQGAALDVNEELVAGRHPFGSAASAIREIRTRLLEGVLRHTSEHRHALAVTSPARGDGKTWVAANLALSLSQLGARTLLIDADLRSPRSHLLFRRAKGAAGLSAILAGRASPNVIRPIRALPSLFLLPSGAVPPNPLELVHGSAFGILLRQVRMKFQYVVVDTPAAEEGSDHRVIAAECGAALVVGRRGSTRMDAVRRMVDGLRGVGTEIGGVVLNAD